MRSKEFEFSLSFDYLNTHTLLSAIMRSKEFELSLSFDR